MVVDGYDVQYLLKKKGFSLTDVARQLSVTTPSVYQAVYGIHRSQRVINHIEKLLGMAPNTLEISREKRDAIVKVG